MHCKSYSHFFSKKFQNICVSVDVNFNESLTNDVVSFEQLGPDCGNVQIDLNIRWAHMSESPFSVLRLSILYHAGGIRTSVTAKHRSTLVISKSKRLFEILRDIRTSTYQICKIEEKNRTTIFHNEFVV